MSFVSTLFRRRSDDAPATPGGDDTERVFQTASSGEQLQPFEPSDGRSHFEFLMEAAVDKFHQGERNAALMNLCQAAYVGATDGRVVPQQTALRAMRRVVSAGWVIERDGAA